MYASACGLSGGESNYLRTPGKSLPDVDNKEWRVVPAVKDGVLAARVVEETKAGPTQQLMLDRGAPCKDARLSGTSDFFISEHAKSPLPLLNGQQLWALVTVPPSGPVRPVKLAISDSTGFHLLDLD
jgi:hypothetical protein